VTSVTCNDFSVSYALDPRVIPIGAARRRAKTLRLIATMNPRWQDLAADWYETAAIVPKPALPKVPGLWRPFTW